MDSDSESLESDAEYEEPNWPPIFRAVMDLDVQALRRELASGVDVNLMEDGARLIHFAVQFGSAFAEKQLQERLECISMLLEAGASVSSVCWDGTPLHHAASNESPAFHPVITLLMESGADVNAVDSLGDTVLASAAESGTAGAVRMLISAGAVGLDRALDLAITNGKRRNCAQLIRAGAALPAVITAPHPRLERLGFPANARLHREHPRGGRLPGLREGASPAPRGDFPAEIPQTTGRNARAHRYLFIRVRGSLIMCTVKK